MLRNRGITAARLLAVAGVGGALVLGLLGQGAEAADYETIKPGKLVVAFNGDMPGTSWENGKLIGLDGEILQRVAEELGLEIEPALMEWSAEIASVTSGRADIMLGMMGWTPQRAEVMNVTDPLYYAGTRVTQKKSTNYRTLDDLKNKRIAMMTGTSAVEEIKQVPGVDLKLYDTLDAALRALMDDRVDLAFVDSQSVQYGIQRNPDWDIQQITIEGPYNPDFPNTTAKWNVVMGVRKEAPGLAQAINEQLAKIWTTCENRKIAESYGLGEQYWFTPPDQNARAGVDRPKDWKQPTLPADCR